MINLKPKTVFAFFDSKAVQSRLSPAVRKFLGWAGGLTMKVARRSLRPARMKKKSEMTDEETEAYEKRVAWAEANNLPKPKRPLMPSAPDEPPRLKNSESPLKRLIFYGLDLKTETTFIGPVKARSGIADVLEYGGVSNGKTIAARPFVRPARAIVEPQLQPYWKDLIHK
ncbi:hypothetical protein [Paremcibacter congregatus]|uniref:hypothetical protein n=1 Tax=Paremcibacter congregatus TaxID=2043170 RepID=UPI003A95CA15